jgi:tetratricopeptide (TPR) repeat protein
LLGLQLLQVLIPQGKLQEAMQLLDRAPDRARRSPRIHAAYGDVHLAAGRYKQAAESYRAAMLHRTDGKPVLDSIAMPADGDGAEWKAVAERLQAALRNLRKDAAEDDFEDERSEVRRPRLLRSRQAMRARA